MSPSAVELLKSCGDGESVCVEFPEGVVFDQSVTCGTLSLVGGVPVLTFIAQEYTVSGRPQLFTQVVGSNWVADSAKFTPVVSDPWR